MMLSYIIRSFGYGEEALSHQDLRPRNRGTCSRKCREPGKEEEGAASEPTLLKSPNPKAAGQT